MVPVVHAVGFNMYEEIKCLEVQCRRNHGCEWCNETVSKGEKAQYRVYVFEGDFNTGWMHPECWRAMEDSPNDVISERWVPGEPQRGKILG